MTLFRVKDIHNGCPLEPEPVDRFRLCCKGLVGTWFRTNFNVVSLDYHPEYRLTEYRLRSQS